MAVPKPEVEPVISQTREVVMVADWCVGWNMLGREFSLEVGE
jgi:hypothetical protein